MKLPFYSDCVNWPSNRLDVLRFLVDEGDPITRPAFMRRADVGLEPLRMRSTPGCWIHADAAFGPWPETWDYAVSYHRMFGWPVVWFRHSAVEYVFTRRETVEELAAAIAQVEA